MPSQIKRREARKVNPISGRPKVQRKVKKSEIDLVSMCEGMTKCYEKAPKVNHAAREAASQRRREEAKKVKGPLWTYEGPAAGVIRFDPEAVCQEIDDAYPQGYFQRYFTRPDEGHQELAYIPEPILYTPEASPKAEVEFDVTKLIFLPPGPPPISAKQS